MEGLEKVFSGKNVLPRQICLFSVCGIAGLINGYFSLYKTENVIVTTGLTLLLILFSLFFTGYEILFLKERELPDIDMQSFKIAFKKIPFIIFLAGIPILLLSLFTNNFKILFIIQAIISVPLTMMQAGFSFNFDNNDAFCLFKKFSIKDYILLLLKWIGIFILCYLIVFVIIFFTFFAGGIVMYMSHQVDITNFALLISSNQTVIAKFAAYLTGILLTYFTSLGALVWDYEVLRTYEKL